MRRKDNLHCSPVPSMHTFDETTRKLQRVIFSFSAHFSSSTDYLSCLYRSQTPFAFSSLFAYSYSIPPQKLRNLSCSCSSPLFVVMPVEDVPNFGPMMASLSPLLKRRVSHLKQARESRIGSRSTGTQEQEVLLTGPSLVERSIQVKRSQSPESQRSLYECYTDTACISDELMMMVVQRSFHHIPTRLHRATRHIQSFKKLPPPLIKVACGSAFARGQLLPGADWETNDLPLFKKKIDYALPECPQR